MRTRPHRVPCLLAMIGLVVMCGGAFDSPARAQQTRERPRPRVIIHESIWDAGQPGSWSAFTIRVSSAPGFDGELWLVSTPLPQRQQAQLQQQPGQPPLPPPEPPAPSIRAPLSLDPGIERLVSVMAPVGDAAYRAEVHDRSGALVFAGQARGAFSRTAYNLGLLTDRRSGEAVFQVGSQLPVSISRRFRSVVEFPTDPLALEGLEAIVVADFDSGTLSTQQHRALQDFVAMGGALITTGGAAARRTVSSLPEVLVPLRPDATTLASLAPLVELAGETTDAVTTVATGELRTGRVVVGGIQGPPLVVEARYGLGSIVQLAYDPYAVLAEQRSATGALRSLPWSVGLLRITGDIVNVAQINNSGQLIAPPPRPEWGVLDKVPEPEPSKGGPAGLLLVAYPFLMGGAAFVLGKERGKPAWRWGLVPGLAAFVAVAVIPFEWGLRGSLVTGDEVVIEHLGSAGAPNRVESFHRLVPSARGDTALRLQRGTLATTAAAPRPALGLPRLLAERNHPPIADSDLVRLHGDTGVELNELLGWDVRRMHTLSLSAPDGDLESHLRLQGARVVGTVTNHGKRPLLGMRAQTADGTFAHLTDNLPVGGTLSVDAPFAGARTPADDDVEGRLLAAAAASVSGDLHAGEVVVVASVPEQPTVAAQNGYRPNSAHRAVVTTVALEGADDFAPIRHPDGTLQGDLRFGMAEAVCCGAPGQGFGVYELRLPTGAPGPFAIEKPSTPLEPSIFDWTTGTWRPLGTATQVPLAPSDIKDGLVRVRALIQGPAAIKAVSLTAPETPAPGQPAAPAPPPLSP